MDEAPEALQDEELSPGAENQTPILDQSSNFTGGDSEDFSHPIQATTDAGKDLNSYMPFVVRSERKARRIEQSPDNETLRESAVVSTPFENTASSATPFSGKDVSARMQDDVFTGLQYSQSSHTLPNGRSSRMVVGYTESAGDEISQEDMKQAEAQVYGILREDCNPITVCVLVANDNKTALQGRSSGVTTQSVITAEDIASRVDINHDYKPAQSLPEFDAVKSCSELKSKLESSGVMVFPVINRSKSYLTAVMKILAQAAFPKSCELFWFIFTGHGRKSNMCMNGQLMEFDDLIKMACDVKMRYFAFFFECCQLNNDLIKASRVQQEHMTIYSSPPNKVSYFYEGVGLMVICLAEMLKEGYKKSLNELQRELRSKMIEKIQKVLIIPSHTLKSFLNEHLPVHTSTMFEDINIHEKTQDAMSPKISVSTSVLESKNSVCVTIYNPKRLIHHPSTSSYELVKYIVTAKPGDGEEVDLVTTDAAFSDDPVQVPVTLPPQIKATSGAVRVKAEYGDGLVVTSKTALVEDWPCYEKPTLSFTREHGGYAASVAFDPNITVPNHEYYHIEYIDIGFHTSLNCWLQLDHKESYNYTKRCQVIFPPSRSPVKRYLQVAVKYKSYPEPIYSDCCEVDQPGISRPEILEVKKVDDLATSVKFSPHTPPLASSNSPYKVNGYFIQSRLKDSEWIEVHRKMLQEGESLQSEEEVLVKSHLSAEARRCEYRVTLCYDDDNIGEMKSDTFTFIVDPQECPRKVEVIENRGSSTKIGWSHSVSKDSKFHNALEYNVVKDNGSCQQTELEGEWTMGKENMLVKGSHRRSLKVGFHFKDKPELGSVYSDLYKGSNLHNCVRGCWNYFSTAFKCWCFLLILFLAILILFSAIPSVVIPCILNVRVAETRLIVANQTISYEQSDFHGIICAGINVMEYTNKTSDNLKGLNVSAFSVERSEVKTEQVVIPSSEYPGVNRSIDSEGGKDEVRYLVPFNYYSYPVYLLNGSAIALQSRIYAKDDGDTLSYALVHMFISREDAVNYQLGKGFVQRKPQYTFNLTNCVSSECTWNYTVSKNAFYFPVFASKAGFDFDVTTNFTFHVIRYNVSSFNTSGVDLVTKNVSRFLEFHKSKLTLFYANPPAHFYERKMSHLNFTCSAAGKVMAPIFVSSFLPLIMCMIILAAVYVYKKFFQRTHRPGILTEKSPLIQKP